MEWSEIKELIDEKYSESGVSVLVNNELLCITRVSVDLDTDEIILMTEKDKEGVVLEELRTQNKKGFYCGC